MTEETPRPEGEPTPAPPEETPTAETKPFTYDDAVQQAGAEPDPPAASTPPPAAEQPTQAAPAAAPAPAATAAAPVAAAPVAAAPVAERPAGIFIPKWLGIVAAAIVAALIFGGIGYAIGDSSSGDSGTQNASNAVPNNGNQFPGNQFPGNQFPGNQFPGNNGNGNGNGNNGNNGNNGGAQEANAGFLGVGVQTASDNKGVEVTDVADGSPAADAGLKQGDVITAVDGDSVTSAAALRSAIQAKKSGDEISVTYTRDGASNTVKVTLTSRSEAQSS
jgi:membrane-associated protease RseP (regulator of RpoE activity)